jgi:hypothetical protein
MRVVFVHGACVRDGSWWWHRIGGLLREQGVASVSPALPSCGEEGVPAGGRGCPRMSPPCGRCSWTATSRPQAPAHLARQSVQVTGQPVGAAAWRDVPSTYLVCAQDRGTPAGLQREFARRAGRVVEFDAGHHPFLSRPAAVRDLLLGLDAFG